jgi:hypothetical protein
MLLVTAAVLCLPLCCYRWSSIKSLWIGMGMTLFTMFDVPVFWPILLLYWLLLFTVTMKRQIKHMIKYRYLPFTTGKKVCHQDQVNAVTGEPCCDQQAQQMPLGIGDAFMRHGSICNPLRFMTHVPWSDNICMLAQGRYMVLLSSLCRSTQHLVARRRSEQQSRQCRWATFSCRQLQYGAADGKQPRSAAAGAQ